MKSADLFYLLGRGSGVAGFACLSFLIFSGDTAKFFDRFFGLDKIIKFQRKFSLLTAVFVALHPIFFILSTGSINYLIPDFTIIPLAIGVTAFYVFIAVMIASLLYKRISYNIWQYIHILTYLLFFSGLYHAVNWGSDGNLMYIRGLYITLLIAVITGIIYRTAYKIKKRYAGKFYVKEIEWESKDAFTLTLIPPREFLFKAGQFCFLRLNKNNLHARHPFTIASSPWEKYLRFVIKIQGRFTKTVSQLEKGEEVLVEGPFGIFTLKKSDKDFVFIAGGVGIAPFMAMIRDNEYNRRRSNILLLYGSKTEREIIFKDTLDKIERKWLKKVYVLSQEFSPSKGCEKGYIDKIILEKYVKNINDSLFYICGPEAMKTSVTKVLFELGVDKKNIIIEDFFW